MLACKKIMAECYDTDSEDFSNIYVDRPRGDNVRVYTNVDTLKLLAIKTPVMMCVNDSGQYRLLLLPLRGEKLDLYRWFNSFESYVETCVAMHNSKTQDDILLRVKSAIRIYKNYPTRRVVLNVMIHDDDIPVLLMDESRQIIGTDALENKPLTGLLVLKHFEIKNDRLYPVWILAQARLTNQTIPWLLDDHISASVPRANIAPQIGIAPPPMSSALSLPEKPVAQPLEKAVVKANLKQIEKGPLVTPSILRQALDKMKNKSSFARE
jgi:hypothetical protein